MTPQRGHAWLRALVYAGIGLVVGIGLGLYLGWVAWPAEFTNANPSVLETNHRRDYLLMIADAYAVEGDVAAAQQRLAGMGEGGQEFLMSTLLDMILRVEDEGDIRRLARLADDLGLYSPAMEPYLASPEPAP